MQRSQRRRDVQGRGQARREPNGISSTKLSAAERGLVTLTRAEGRVVARALGATPEALFGDGELPC